MNNPIDILGVHPTGALLKTVDERDYTFDSPEIGGASLPFDWNAGYDVENEIGILLPTKNQGQAGSCGGETISTVGQCVTSFYLGEKSEKSAKAPYSQVFVQGGGSSSRALGEIYKNQGIYKESLVPSYMSGNPPTEAFMEQASDITPEARADAALTKGLFAYAYMNLDIDTMAQALRDHKGILIGIHGSNNGTWLSSRPSPVQNGAFWAHFMAGGKANMDNGKKTIWAKQSWGSSVAPETNAYQAITEDHFNAGRIWDGMVLVYSPLPPKTSHVFNVDIAYGQTSPEVTALQTALAHDGVFNLAPTGYYGNISSMAVLKFRLKHGIDSSTDPLGKIVGPRTRAALNNLAS